MGSNKLKGTLELNWINKDKSLLYEIDEEEGRGVKPVWVDKDDIRVSEPRNLKLVEEFGDPNNENMLIKGDNLLALRRLVEEFKNRDEKDKVKCIYIDPPYNTGAAFENYDDNLEHSQWLTMMQDRLVLLKKLLRKDGIIFVQIDDEEEPYLKVLMNEIFGRRNKIATLIWDLGTGTTAGHFTRSHEYILAYAKEKDSMPNFENPDENAIVRHGALKKPSRINPFSRITFPAGMEFEGENATFQGVLGVSEKQKIVDEKMVFENGKLKHPVTLEAGWAMRNQILSWLEGKETFDSKGQRVIRFYFNRSGILWYEKEKTIVNPRTVLSDFGSTKTGTKEVENILPGKTFDFPKPEKLVSYLIRLTTREGDVVLDSFAGSGTTGAVAHKTGRRWIMIEIGNHCLTHIIPRLKQIIGKSNSGFRYYVVGKSLISDSDINWELTYEEIARALFMMFDYSFAGKLEDEVYMGEKNGKYALSVTSKELDIIRADGLDDLVEKVKKKRKNVIELEVLTNKGVGVKEEDLPDGVNIRKIPESVLRKYKL